jgi:hypothetical protein
MRAVTRSLLLVAAAAALVLAAGQLVHHYVRLGGSFENMVFF